MDSTSQDPSVSTIHQQPLPPCASELPLKLCLLDSTILIAGPMLTGAALAVFWARSYRYSDDLYFNGMWLAIFAVQFLIALVLPVYLSRCYSRRSPNKARAAIAVTVFLSCSFLPVCFDLYFKAGELGRAQVEAEIGGFPAIEAECRQVLQSMTDKQLMTGTVPPEDWPPGIRRLKPYRVGFGRRRVRIEFGSGMDHYGYTYADDQNGTMTLRHSP